MPHLKTFFHVQGDCNFNYCILIPLSLILRPTWPGDEATLVSDNINSESQENGNSRL